MQYHCNSFEDTQPMTLKAFFLPLLATLIWNTAVSQETCTVTLRGKILHAENNEPIENAFIWVDELESGFISDEKGNFRIDHLCKGSYSIKVTYLGHQEERKTINLEKNSSVTFRMKGEDIELEGIEIHGHRDAVITTSTVSSLRGRSLDELRGENLGEMLQSISGVTTFSTGASIDKPVIHGLHSNRILILNNGIRQEGQQWGSEHAPEIDPFMADEIAVVKGAETVRFGPEAMGGVIVVNPSPLPVSKELMGEMNLIGASNGRSGTVAMRVSGGSGKIKGLGYRIQSSGKYGGNIQSPDYYQSNTGTRELNFSGALGYSSSLLGMEIFFSRYETTRGILSDAHTGNLSDLQAIINNGRPFRKADFSYEIVNPRQEVIHDLLKFKAHYHMPDGAKWNFQYGFQQNQRQEFDKRRGVLNNKAALDLELFTHTLDLSYEHAAKRHWNGSVGVNLMQQANNNIPGTGVTPLIPNFDLFNFGLFAIEKYTKGHFELEGGLRFDHRFIDAARYTQDQKLEERNFTFRNFTAFLGSIYSLTQNITFSTNIGSAWRPPNINEQFSQGLHHGSAAYEYGNPEFKSEKAYKWINTLSYSGKGLNVEITGYLNHINHYIYLNPTEEPVISLRGTFNVFHYEQTNARLWGFDLTSNYDIHSSLEWYAKGAMIRAKDVSNGNFLPLIPVDRIESGLTYKIKQVGKLTQTRFTISNLMVAQQTQEPDFDFAPAPKGYNLWDVTMSTNLPLGKSKFNAGLAVTNVFDTAYKEYMNRFRYFSHEMGRNITLRIKYNF